VAHIVPLFLPVFRVAVLFSGFVLALALAGGFGTDGVQVGHESGIVVLQGLGMDLRHGILSGLLGVLVSWPRRAFTLIVPAPPFVLYTVIDSEIFAKLRHQVMSGNPENRLSHDPCHSPVICSDFDCTHCNGFNRFDSVRILSTVRHFALSVCVAEAPKGAAMG
jgi:hypothetical protein